MFPLLRNLEVSKSKKRQISLPHSFNFSLLNFGPFFAYEYAGIVQVLVQCVLNAEE